MGTKSTPGASAVNQTTIIGHIDGIETLLAAIQTAVEIIDNFISGARGLVTEDNSAAALTALQTIDNFISGARGLVTEDSAAAILIAVQIMDDWDETNRAAVNLIASQAGITGGAGAVGASSPRVTLASDDPAVVDLAAIEVLLTTIDTVLDTIKVDTEAIETAVELIDNASVDHGATAVAGVTQVGFEGEDYGTTPGLVNDNDATRPLADTQGIQFVIGGAPHLITREIAHGTDAATNENMAAALVGAAEVCVVTRAWATADADNTGDISVRMGFGASAVPTASASGVSGMIMSHGGVPAGGGFVVGDGSGIVAVGAAGEEPRITTEAASTNLHTGISFYIVDQT